MSLAERIARWAVMLSGGLLAVGLGYSTVYRAGPHTLAGKTWGSTEHRTDFTAYQQAGHAVLDGVDIYDAHSVRGWYFMYLPAFAVAMAPFALVNTFWAVLAWYVLSVAMFAHAVHLSARLARRVVPATTLSDFWLHVVTGLLIARPSISGIARGQASSLVTYLVVLSVWLYVERREWFAAFCLAGSIVLKIFPALLGVYFLAKRRWTMVIATGLWLILLVWIAPSAVFGVRGNVALLQRWVTTIALPANQPDESAGNVRYGQMIDPRIPRNQSVQAVLIRAFGGDEREPLARRVALAINAGLALVAMWACRQGRADNGAPATVVQLCVVAMLMLFLSPVSWNHNYTALVLPLALAAAAATVRMPVPARRVFRLTLAAYFGLSIVSMPVKPLYAYGALLWGALAVWAAFVWWLMRRDTRTS